ncbi:hypothetical protein Tco_0328396 [Tanacetum coccineum]
MKKLLTDSEILATLSGLQSDGVMNFETASELNRHSEALEDSAKRRRQDYKATPSCDSIKPTKEGRFLMSDGRLRRQRSERLFEIIRGLDAAAQC